MATAVDISEEALGLLGTTLDGRYRLEEVLGVGAVGVVFLARDGVRPVAVKRMRRCTAASERLVERFRREARTLAMLCHDKLLRYVGSGDDAFGRPYIATEYLEGLDVWELLKLHGPFPEELGVDLLRQTAEGLQALHALGVVHRDLKPDNLYLVPDGRGGHHPWSVNTSSTAPLQGFPGSATTPPASARPGAEHQQATSVAASPSAIGVRRGRSRPASPRPPAQAGAGPPPSPASSFPGTYDSPSAATRRCASWSKVAQRQPSDPASAAPARHQDEADPEVPAHDGQGVRVQVPAPARQRQRADEGQVGRPQTSALAAGEQDGSVERLVVCGQEARACEDVGQRRPQLGEGRLPRHHGPGDPVDTRVDELSPGRADEVRLAPHDTPALDLRQPHGAGAVPPVVRGLDVDRYEALKLGAGRLIWNSLGQETREPGTRPGLSR